MAVERCRNCLSWMHSLPPVSFLRLVTGAFYSNGVEFVLPCFANPSTYQYSTCKRVPNQLTSCRQFQEKPRSSQTPSWLLRRLRLSLRPADQTMKNSLPFRVAHCMWQKEKMFLWYCGGEALRQCMVVASYIYRTHVEPPRIDHVITKQMFLLS